jgi:hypothetical protein
MGELKRQRFVHGVVKSMKKSNVNQNIYAVVKTVRMREWKLKKS